MTTKTKRVLLAAMLLAGSAALFTPASAAPTLSGSVATHLQDAQKAAGKKDFAAAATAVAAAKEASKSDFDKYTTARVGIAVYYQNNDIPGAADAAQTAAESPAQPDAEKAANLKTAMELSMVTKNYPKAIQYAKTLEGLTPPPDAATAAQIGQAYYFGGDFADAKASAQKVIDADVKAGRTPDRNSLQVLMSAQVGLKDDAGAQATLEQQVKYYGDLNDWAQMIDVAITSPGIRDVDAIWLGRLLFATGAKVTPDDANMIGGIAGHLTFFGDAVNAKTHGGTVDPDPVPRADADKKTIPQQIAAIPAQNGTYSAKLAEALYSYGMYPEAEAAAAASIAKGGNAQDPSEAQMVLGQAQALQGKYDDALASFGKVTGGSPATARIVRLWVDYTNLKKNPPAAAASPAATAAK